MKRQTTPDKPSRADPSPAPSALDGLTGKQRAFVVEYLRDFNATRAALAAGYSNKCPAELGYEALRNPQVAAAVAEQLEAKGITPERIKVRLAGIVFGADLADFEPYMTGEKTLRELAEMGVATWLVKKARARILRRTVKDDGTEEVTLTREVELLDPLAAVRELDRVLGIVTERRETTVSGGVGLDLGNMSDAELRRLARATGDVEIAPGQDKERPVGASGQAN